MLAQDLDKEFIDVPDVAQPALFLLQFSGVAGTKLLTPVSDGFIGNADTPFG